ncbi:MAG: pyridoxamine 5'-phosphate oxidase [Woeseiaceae bacterium]|nr:pyridoxamine 5'-phosphate oxidase [Woeseiaceae bacterium]
MASPYMEPMLPPVLPDEPLEWAAAWLAEAERRAVQRNPNSMTLATVAADGRPSARVVLCKQFVVEPGFVVFYTNYQSRKSHQIAGNARVAATFHWDALGRQVRLEGIAVRSPDEESDDYFRSRHWGSQLGAWGSDQSTPIVSRRALLEQLRARAAELGLPVTDDLQSLTDGEVPAIPRPPHWGGFRVWPETVELWIEGMDRIHDRALWTRQLTPAGDHEFTAGPWSGSRLQP